MVPTETGLIHGVYHHDHNSGTSTTETALIHNAYHSSGTSTTETALIQCIAVVPPETALIHSVCH